MSGTFRIRRMTPADKPALLDIASRIWEGTDYLPRVFDEWVQDRDGEFAAVCLGDQLVGCGKLTFLTPADAWLEGMRKDPKVQEKGLAAALGRYFLEKLRGRQGLRSVRFSTYFSNRASISTNERLGFRVKAALSLKAWDGTLAQARARAGIELPAVTAVEEVTSYLARAGTVPAHGLVVEGWRVYPYSPGLVSTRYMETGACRGLRRGGALDGLAIATLVRGTDRTMVRLVHLDAADPAGAAVLLGDVFARAVRFTEDSGSDRVELEWSIPRDARLHQLAGALGLESGEQEDDFLVYELPTAGTATGGRATVPPWQSWQSRAGPGRSGR
jgi:RimJ/RimL family protein N-acetyltransferase